MLFHRFPAEPKLPELYLLLAKALSEGLGEDRQALAVLDFVLRQFPESPVLTQVQSYRRTLQQLLESPAC